MTLVQEGTTPSFYTGVDCQWLPFLRDLPLNLAAIAIVNFRPNDSVSLVQAGTTGRSASLSGSSRQRPAGRQRPVRRGLEQEIR
jgi:hypothetical protein